MRALRLAWCFLFLLTTAVAESPADDTIGHINGVKGKWCRGGTELKKPDVIKFQDDIRYCLAPFAQDDYLEIEFHRHPPLLHRYGCDTPGVCSSPRSSLYLTGFYLFGEPAGPRPGPLIDRPRTTSFRIHDYVIDHALQLPDSVQELVHGRKAMMCRIDFPQFNTTSFLAQEPKVDQCVTGDFTTSLTPGSLYGIYLSGHSSTVKDHQSPLGLVLYSYPNSKSLSQWNGLAPSLRAKDDDVSVWDRRSIILKLLDNEMLYAPDSPSIPEQNPKLPQTQPPTAAPASAQPAPPPQAAATPKQ